MITITILTILLTLDTQKSKYPFWASNDNNNKNDNNNVSTNNDNDNRYTSQQMLSMYGTSLALPGEQVAMMKGVGWSVPADRKALQVEQAHRVLLCKMCKDVAWHTDLSITMMKEGSKKTHWEMNKKRNIEAFSAGLASHVWWCRCSVDLPSTKTRQGSWSYTSYTAGMQSATLQS